MLEFGRTSSAWRKAKWMTPGRLAHLLAISQQTVIFFNKIVNYSEQKPGSRLINA